MFLVNHPEDTGSSTDLGLWLPWRLFGKRWMTVRRKVLVLGNDTEAFLCDGAVARQSRPGC